MGRLYPTCFATNSESIYLIANAVSSDKNDGATLVLAKSEPFPTNPGNITWSIVSTVPERQVSPFILPKPIERSFLTSVQCIVDNNGVFTAGSRGLDSTGRYMSVRYDPKAALSNNSRTIQESGNIGGSDSGHGEWSVDIRRSDSSAIVRFVNVKDTANSSNTIYQIRFQPSTTYEIELDPMTMGIGNDTRKNVILKFFDVVISSGRNRIYSLNGTAVQRTWTTEPDNTGAYDIVPIPSQANGNHPPQYVLLPSLRQTNYASLDQSNDPVRLTMIPDIIVPGDMRTPVEHFDPPHDCGYLVYRRVKSRRITTIEVKSVETTQEPTETVDNTVLDVEGEAEEGRRNDLTASEEPGGQDSDDGGGAGSGSGSKTRQGQN
ncbi:hypothetical protein BGX27_002622 [Mortierella sp. AM989]|nr:hypothetical protein BGX27_002622 [Mortierella sp. AM989]